MAAARPGSLSLIAQAPLDLLQQLSLFIISLLANGLSALAGGGAGLLQLPVLLFLGLSFATALATHKIASVALGLGATLRHLQEGRLQPRFALFILGSGLPGVVLGAIGVLRLPEAQAILALGCLTTGLGLYSFFKKQLGLSESARHRSGLGLLAGGVGLFAIGLLNGSLTSGTGLFVTLWLVRWYGLEYRQAVAYTLILVGLFWNASGALTVAVQTDPQWDWLPALIAGAVIGAYLGAHWGLSRSNRFIKRAFECLTLAVGLKLIYDGLRLGYGL